MKNIYGASIALNVYSSKWAIFGRSIKSSPLALGVTIISEEFLSPLQRQNAAFTTRVLYSSSVDSIIHRHEPEYRTLVLACRSDVGVHYSIVEADHLCALDF